MKIFKITYKTDHHCRLEKRVCFLLAESEQDALELFNTEIGDKLKDGRFLISININLEIECIKDNRKIIYDELVESSW